MTLLLLLNVLHLNVFQVPEIDNFYLDMNGIIHNCSSVTLDTLPTQLTRHNFVTSRTLDGLPRRPNYPCPFEVGGQIIPAFVLTDCALLFFVFWMTSSLKSFQRRHPNDIDPNFVITEEQIFKDVCGYLNALFLIIKPQNLFYMAVVR